jgi:dienelactone hydrolase
VFDGTLGLPIESPAYVLIELFSQETRMRSFALTLGTLLVGVAVLASPSAAEETGLSLLATGPRDVELTTEDDVTIEATFYAASDARLPPAVILVAGPGEGRGVWGTVASELTARGIAVLAIDPRPGSDGEHATLIPNDIRAGIRFLREREDIDGVRVAVVGAALGANAAAAYAVDDHLLVGLGLLSPVLELNGLAAAEAVHGYGERPALLVAGEGDTASASALGVLEEKARGEARVVRVAGAAHGVALLQSFKARVALLEWLDGVLGSS